jgi:hypothetical protein
MTPTSVSLSWKNVAFKLITMNCMPGLACSLTYCATRPTFTLSSAASTSSSTKNGLGW